MAKQIWKQNSKDKIYVTNGSRTLTLGDKVAYVATGTDYNGNWLLLGVNDRGRALLISEKNVATQTLCGRRGYDRGIKILNRMCKKYGKGKGAVKAHSITLQDLFKIKRIFNASMESMFLKRFDAYKRLKQVYEKFDEFTPYWIANSYKDEQLGKTMFGLYAARDSALLEIENFLLERDNFSYKEVEYTRTYGVRPIVEVDLNKLFKS